MKIENGDKLTLKNVIRAIAQLQIDAAKASGLTDNR